VAHLTDADRGQIILVAAFALGVIFIALAVVVNTAIFTENLATRGQGTSDDDPLQYRHEVEQSVGTVLEYVNAEYDGSGSLVDQLENNISTISAQGGVQKAQLGRVVTIDNDTQSRVDGWRFQNTTGEFVDSGDNSTWTVASGLSQTRGFVLTVDSTSSLSSTESGSFTVSVNESAGGPFWNLSVYNSSGDTVTVAVNNTDGATASCTRSVSGQFDIDVTGGTVAGEPCHALTTSDGNEMWFPSTLSGYDIRFVNANQVSGGYRGVVAGSEPSASANPTDAIYSLYVHYTYQTPSLYYETGIRVAPGEPES